MKPRKFLHVSFGKCRHLREFDSASFSYEYGEEKALGQKSLCNHFLIPLLRHSSMPQRLKSLLILFSFDKACDFDCHFYSTFDYSLLNFLHPLQLRPCLNFANFAVRTSARSRTPSNKKGKNTSLCRFRLCRKFKEDCCRGEI